MIAFKVNSSTVNIPTFWDELTMGQYLQVMEIGDDYIKAVAILTGLDYEILKTANTEGLELVIPSLAFMNKTPDFTGTVDKVGTYRLPKNDKGQFNIQFESLAQFEDMRAVIKTCSDAKSIAHAFPKFVAIYLQKIRDTDYSYSKAIEMVPEVMAMPAKEVIITGSFFYVKLRILLSGTLKTSPPTTPSQKKKKPVSAGSRKSSGRR